MNDLSHEREDGKTFREILTLALTLTLKNIVSDTLRLNVTDFTQRSSMSRDAFYDFIGRKGTYANNTIKILAQLDYYINNPKRNDLMNKQDNVSRQIVLQLTDFTKLPEYAALPEMAKPDATALEIFHGKIKRISDPLSRDVTLSRLWVESFIYTDYAYVLSRIMKTVPWQDRTLDLSHMTTLFISRRFFRMLFSHLPQKAGNLSCHGTWPTLAYYATLFPLLGTLRSGGGTVQLDREWLTDLRGELNVLIDVIFLAQRNYCQRLCDMPPQYQNEQQICQLADALKNLACMIKLKLLSIEEEQTILQRILDFSPKTFAEITLTNALEELMTMRNFLDRVISEVHASGLRELAKRAENKRKGMLYALTTKDDATEINLFPSPEGVKPRLCLLTVSVLGGTTVNFQKFANCSDSEGNIVEQRLGILALNDPSSYSEVLLGDPFLWTYREHYHNASMGAIALYRQTENLPGNDIFVFFSELYPAIYDANAFYQSPQESAPVLVPSQGAST